MEDKQKNKIMKEHLNKINEHFLKNDNMTSDEYAEISKPFLLDLLKGLL